MTSIEHAGGVWTWVVDLYGRPGVGDACLALQDQHGADVTLLLYLVHAGSEGRNVTAGEIAVLDQKITTFRREVTGRLRAARSWLKPRAADPALSALRQRILDVELEAERWTLEALSTGSTRSTDEPPPDAATGNAAPRITAGANVGRYLTSLGAGDDADPHAAVILTAAFPGAAAVDIVRP